MNDPLASRLLDDAIMLLDGGLATELEARGHDLDDPLWSARLLIDDPEAIAAVHRTYLEAGADVATAASYQASLPGLRARGLDESDARHVLLRAVELAREACTDAASNDPERARPLAVASLGAYGAFLADGSEYRGDYTASDATLQRYHLERLELLASHADLVAFETIPCLREAECIARVLERSPAPAWVSFCARDDAHVGHGETIERCAAAVLGSPSVVAVGINCCAPGHVEGLLRRLAAITDRPLLAYPNAGERYADGGWCGSRSTPEQLVALADRWVDAGARILGGCCRTGPDHIAALDRWRRQR
ncbi:MAG: homocysteine S-methyltransferase [Myxococcota bacterium]